METPAPVFHRLPQIRPSFHPYNLSVADHFLCSCVTCPACGAWVVVERELASGRGQQKFRAVCAVPDCGREFGFEEGETRIFELPASLFERRHFYGSELRTPQ
jgi:hypothetical protein